MTDEKLGTAPVGKLVVGMALPAVAAQLVNALYNIVDRIYIGHIPEAGAMALTGLGVCFPILMLVAAFSAFAGMGGAPLAAIQLGKGNRQEAEKILGNAAWMLCIFSIFLTVFFMISKRPLLLMFGASEKTLPYALSYLQIYLCGTVFVQMALGLNMFITCQGKAGFAMFSVMIGAACNIILDPVFIFVLGMGVRGAALATVISQALSSIWVTSFLLSKKSGIRLVVENLKPDRKVIGNISALGISPFVMQSTESLISITFNSGLKHYGGDMYVASMTILQSIMQMVVIPIQGFTQGTQPIISYNYGAGNDKRILKAFRIILAVTMAFTVSACLMTMIFPKIFASVFTSDQELIRLVGRVLPVYMGGMWIFGVQMACQSAFMGMGQAKISLFLAMLRKIVLLIPLAVIFPKFFGVIGIYYAEPVSDITAATVTGIIFFTNIKKILEKK